MTDERPTYDFGYFTSLSLENVRCFAERQTLDLSEADGSPAKWTILLGNNGTGKTTVLQCLVLVDASTVVPDFSVRDSSLLEDLANVAGPKFRSRWPAPPGVQVFELLKRRADAACDVAASLEFGTKSPVELHSRWENDGRSSTSSRGNRSGEAILCAYGASRKPGTASLTGNTQKTGNTATLFDETATLLSPDEWLLQADYAAKSAPNDPRARQRFEQIRDALVDLMEDVSELRVAGLEDRPPAPRVEAKTPFGWVRVRDLSLGYRTLMTWVVDFAQRLFARYPESDDPLAEPAVCLVDEIDLHLHPRWQRGLIGYLDRRFPRTQFIVTAHSPLVVQAAEHANVAVLDRHEGDDFVTIHNDRERVRGWRIDQILTSDLFGLEGSRSPKINALMRARRSILGQAELSDADREQLRRLDAELEALPEGEVPEDQQAWDVVRRFAAVLREGETGAGRG